MARRIYNVNDASWRNLDRKRIKELYPDTFAICRGAHSWPSRASWRDMPAAGTRERTMVCTRCGYKKVRLYNTEGLPISREDTDYPPGYRMPKGSGITRQEFVALWCVRDYEQQKRQGLVLGATEE